MTHIVVEKFVVAGELGLTLQIGSCKPVPDSIKLVLYYVYIFNNNIFFVNISL
jgi:hypothetical protein